MENTAIYQTIMFNKTMPFIIVHHTNYSSTPITSHWHPDLEMSILYEGRVDFYISGRHEALTAGDFCLINSSEVHSSIPQIEKSKYKIVGFTLIIKHSFLDTMIRDYSKIFFRVDQIKARQQIAVLMYQISELELAENSEANSFLILGRICEILSILCRDCKHNIADIHINQQRDVERIRYILDYVHENYRSPMLAQDIAQRFYFSRSYFSSFFKQYTGKTFKNYLTALRLSEAEKLLLESDKSIIQIALESGFCDERRFIEAFKQYRQTTPGQYRKCWMEQKQS